jgi:ketosteroid isomerase-like protein
MRPRPSSARRYSCTGAESFGFASWGYSGITRKRWLPQLIDIWPSPSSHGPVWQAQDHDKFVKEFFTHDAIVTASNSATTWHGEKQIAGIIEQVMVDIKDMQPTVVWTRPVGTDAAAQFVTFKLDARDPAGQKNIGESRKTLYVREKTPAGWHVVADHSAYIGMPPN